MSCVAGNACGTVNGYSNRSGRCPACRAAWAKYIAQRRQNHRDNVTAVVLNRKG